SEGIGPADAGARALLSRLAMAHDVVEAEAPPPRRGFRLHPALSLCLDPDHRTAGALQPVHTAHRLHLRTAAAGASVPRGKLRRSVRIRAELPARPRHAEARV